MPRRGHTLVILSPKMDAFGTRAAESPIVGRAVNVAGLSSSRQFLVFECKNHCRGGLPAPMHDQPWNFDSNVRYITLIYLRTLYGILNSAKGERFPFRSSFCRLKYEFSILLMYTLDEMVLE